MKKLFTALFILCNMATIQSSQQSQNLTAALELASLLPQQAQPNVPSTQAKKNK